MQSKFSLIGDQHLASLNMTLKHFQHKELGTHHYHLDADHPELVFCLAFRTVPQDDTGVAHILEHTVLCGSERYPVRDPFFMMMRRSLNTFMNAFTASDWTAYPFASQNEKDFFNLLDVYTDAVFFSHLSELDFAQEGHRLGLDNPDGELEYRGVVFNEMKGAMNSISARLYQSLNRHLFPTSTYHFNSGGDPLAIPKLSHKQLKAFYQKHYHPSNAILFTFGQLAPEQIQIRLEEQALHRFTVAPEPISIAPETRFASPLQVVEQFQATAGQSEQPQDHVVMGWLIGDSTNILEQLEVHVMSELLLGHSGSPLRAALEITDLGSSVSPMMGVDDGQRDIVFACGLEGAQASNADAIEKLILATLATTADQGLPQAEIEAVVDQIELSQREIGGDGMPFGLQLILSALPAAIHRGSVVAHLHIEEALTELRQRMQAPHFLSQLIRQRLLNNPHRVRLTLVADQGYQASWQAVETSQLSALAEKMDAQQRKSLVELNQTLAQHQAEIPDLSCLPQVTRADIPARISKVKPTKQNPGASQFSMGTNGLVYLNWLRALPQLSADQLRWLPIYTGLLGELGQGSNTYQEVQRQVSLAASDVHGHISTQPALKHPQHIQQLLTLSGKSLAHHATKLRDLMQSTVTDTRFDEVNRMHELLQTATLRRVQNLTEQGHRLAMTAAGAYWSPITLLQHQQSGLAGTLWLQDLVKVRPSQYMEPVQHALEKLHNQLAEQPGHLMMVAEAELLARSASDWQAGWSLTETFPQLISVQPELGTVAQHTAWITDTPVQYCARVQPGVALGHPDAMPLAILSVILTHGFLHRAVREQGGAYGGGAQYDMNAGLFRFYSYRDPRFAETFVDFQKSIDWILHKPVEMAAIDEAILSFIGGLDKPNSPAGEATKAINQQLFGRSEAFQNQMRSELLEVTPEAVQRVAETYLAQTSEKASLAVLTHAGQLEQCAAMGMVVTEI